MLLLSCKMLASIRRMNLSDFIADPSRRNALALACETSTDYLWQIATGWRGRKAGPALAGRIEQETERIGHKVPKELIRPDLWEPKRKQQRKAS